ncbi:MULTISPECIES: hypothetical protein [unclassified Pseudomonas]|uniref:hypothetical protein n=1 Tax=unclassified Pseudomonas TaxID=196821 RepID=UPI001A30EAB1|nr:MULTISPECIES: hypothetical protein [unclassified Pseudomonas]MBC8650815.1 hypothetical protein [Pseudomonas sp. MT4]
MAIHFFASEENVACGRTGTSLDNTREITQVTCKLCLRSVEKTASEPVRKTPSLAELRAAAKAEKTAATATEAAKANPAQSPRVEWQQRLAQLPGRSRLPRGASGQAFV